MPAPSAVVLLEALLDDLEADPGWATKVVEEAIGRLQPGLARVIRHVLARDFEYNASDAPADLGLSSVAFRQNKSRAYAALKRIIPAVMRELGINPVSCRIPEVNLHVARDFPTPEEDAERHRDPRMSHRPSYE